MNYKAILLGAVAAAIFAQPASAITLRNDDDQSYKLEVIEGDKSSDVNVSAKAELKDLCQAGCVLRIGEDEYDFDGTETVSIEGGAVYLENIEQGSGGLNESGDVPAEQQGADQ